MLNTKPSYRIFPNVWFYAAVNCSSAAIVRQTPHLSRWTLPWHFWKHVCQMASPWAAIKLWMPHPWDWQREQIQLRKEAWKKFRTSTTSAPLKSWIFFRLLYTIVKIAIITARIILHLISYPQFTYDLFHMHHSVIKTLFVKVQW